MGHPEGLTASEWQEASGMPETSFFRYRKELESKGLVTKNSQLYVLTDHGRSTLTPTSKELLTG